MVVYLHVLNQPWIKILSLSFVFMLFALDIWCLINFIATFVSFEDLTRHLVCDYAAIEHLMQQGNTHRYLVWEILSKLSKS